MDAKKIITLIISLIAFLALSFGTQAESTEPSAEQGALSAPLDDSSPLFPVKKGGFQQTDVQGPNDPPRRIADGLIGRNVPVVYYVSSTYPGFSFDYYLIVYFLSYACSNRP